MRIFNTDIIAHARQCLPPSWRRPLLLAFTDCVVEPLRTLQTRLLKFRTQVAYKLSFTSQVYSLENLLNDRYDNTDRRIYISDGNQVPEIYIYLHAEDIPVYIYSVNEQQPHHIYLEDEPGNFDFIVNYPSALSLNEADATALLERYKLVSKLHTYNTTQL